MDFEPVSSFIAPKCWIFSHESLTLVRPRVAEEPFKKWPRDDRVARSFASLQGNARSAVTEGMNNV